MTKRILIVDDNSTNLYMLETILKGYGLEVVSAENGKDALDKARLSPPDLIVSDILMPVMDGYTLCREWKSDDYLKRIPFVFYTASYTESKDEDFAVSLGADKFILKPQEPDILMNILKEVLKDNYAAKQVTPKPLGEEMELFRQYNEILFNKLEKKMVDLEIANKELEILEERYRLSFENVTDVIYTIDMDFNITSMAPSVERVLGYKPQDFIGRSAYDLGNILMPESFEQALADIGLILKGETISSSVYRFIAKDGTIKYGEVSGSPISFCGRIIGIISVARDVTERKQAEGKLMASKAQLSNAMEMARLGHWEYDVANDLFTFNDNFYKIFHTTVEKIGGYTMHSAEYANRFVHPDDISVVEKEIRKAIESTDPNFNRQIEHRMLYADGTIGYITVRFFVVKDSHGKTVKTYGVNQDTTESKHAVEALLESEGRFNQLAEHSGIIVWEVDAQGLYTYVSHASEAILGYCQSELVGRMHFYDLHPESGREVFKKAAFAVFDRKGMFRNLENEAQTKNGRHVWLSTNGIPLLNTDGTLWGYRGSDTDITVRKQAEQDLQKTLESLRKAFGTIVRVMVSAVETRDPYTAGHQIRSADLACAIATEMGLPQEKIEGLHMAGSIHDIGKLSIPAEILTKPTNLTNIEFSLVKEHARKGYEMLKDVESPWPLAQIVYQHHERMNGSGYPRNLKSDEILIEARILAVADVVEAMASNRPYRPGKGIDAALEEIEKNRGIFYDDAVADACLKLFREKGFQIEQHLSVKQRGE